MQFTSRQFLLYMVLYRCSKREHTTNGKTRNSRNFKRNFKKGVDKSNRLWYNKDVPKGTKKNLKEPTALVSEKEVYYG